MIYKTWHERERLQWHSRTAANGETDRQRERERERERERGMEGATEAKGARMLQRGTGTMYEGVKRTVKGDRHRGRRRGQRRVSTWRFHYGDVSLRQTYALPHTSRSRVAYTSRYFIFIPHRVIHRVSGMPGYSATCATRNMRISRQRYGDVPMWRRASRDERRQKAKNELGTMKSVVGDLFAMPSR